MTAPLSIADKEYAYLSSQYGAGQSMQDMRLKQFGGPTVPAKSEEELAYAYYAAQGGSVLNSRSDNESKFWVGNNSLSDDKNTAGGVVVPPINPLTEGPTAAYGFWAGDPSVTVNDGDFVTNWQGLSNTGGLARPVFKRSDPLLNNKPSLQFNNAQYLLQDVTDIPQNYYMVCIGFSTTTAVTKGMFNTGSPLTSTGLGIRSSGTWYASAGITLDSLIPAVANVPVLIVGKLADTVSEVQVNNGASVVGAGGANLMEWFKIGAQGVGSVVGNYWQGSIAFAAVYTSDPRLDSKWLNILQFARDHGITVPINPLLDGPTTAHGFWAGDPLWVTGKPADGVGAAQWRNGGSVGGDVVQATAGYQPIYKTADPLMNNKPALQFDGTNDCMALDVPDILRPFYVVALVYKGPSTSAKRAIGSGAALTDGLGVTSAGFVASVWGASVVSNTPNIPGVYLMVSKAAASNVYLYINENGSVSSSQNSTTDFAAIMMGSGGIIGTHQYFWDGSIAFVGVYTADPRLDPKWPAIVKFARDHGAPV